MAGLWFEEFEIGQVFKHDIRRTVTETDNVLITTLTHNPAAIHLDAEYANLAGMLRHHLPMPVFVIPGNHDRREGLRRGLAHLPGVTSDPHFVQYAAEGHPVRLVMLDTLVPGAGHAVHLEAPAAVAAALP